MLGEQLRLLEVGSRTAPARAGGRRAAAARRPRPRSRRRGLSSGSRKGTVQRAGRHDGRSGGPRREPAVGAPSRCDVCESLACPVRKATRSCRATSNGRSTTRSGSATATLLERRPGGFPIASLMRPPAEGEDGRSFVGAGARGGRARAVRPPHPLDVADARAADRRPTRRPRCCARGRWLREQGLEPRFFCGGGWYTDADVMAAVAELGYADCTATAWRPVVPSAGLAARRARPARLGPARRRPPRARAADDALARRARPRARTASCRRSSTSTSTTTSCSTRGAAPRSPPCSSLLARRRRRRPGSTTLAAEREVAWDAVCAG